ncbi:unnamed protein product [Rotaria sordida]|uniref:Uncharacterized protein n=1 Tax=Rotaria sordida TaxID=392033 RepID=A0A816BQX0_9BILA|nr:unnamed protein product [Rotaria sordida]CAF1613687.1 unnamed protein product [Rotaria sordida]
MNITNSLVNSNTIAPRNSSEHVQIESDNWIEKVSRPRLVEPFEFTSNNKIGKMVTSHSMAKLEDEIALQNKLLSNMKNSQKDYEEIMLNIETNMDVISNTLLHLRNQLIDSHYQINVLTEENTC